MSTTSRLLPFQPMSMTTAQLPAVSFLARYAGHTHELYSYQLRRWFQWCEGNGLDPLVGIQRAHVELYIRSLGPAGLMASSTNRMMHGVRGFFRFAHIDGLIPADPAVYARLPKVHCDESRTQGLDRLGLIRFLQVAQTITVHHGALAYLLGINALRASEAAAVRIEHYAQTLRGHRVLHLVGKGDKPATMPLTVPVLRVLEACRGQRTTGPLILRPTSGKPIDRRDAYRVTAKVAKAAGVPRHISPTRCAMRRSPTHSTPRSTPRCPDPRPSRRPANHRALRPRTRQPRPPRSPLPHRVRRWRLADTAAGTATPPRMRVRLRPTMCDFNDLHLGHLGVTWVTTAEAGRFLAEAEPFLLSDPVANNALLTEARFWMWLSDPAPGARFGWWAEGNGTHGAFVDLPDHAPVCSPLSAASITDLAGELADATSLGVQVRDVAAVTEAWRAQGQVLRPAGRMTLLRLDSLRPPALPAGTPRIADASDLPLLRSWFKLFQKRHPDDPSRVEFVVDHPLEEGGIIVWEVHGRRLAMASRTPEVAGMTRMGLAFQPTDGTTYSDHAFVSACVEAARTADHVLVLSGTPRSTAAYRSLGFAPVLDRVVLEVLDIRAS